MARQEFGKGEQLILGAIIALCQLLPQPLDAYRSEIGRMREECFLTPGRSRGEITRGYIEGHQVRATDAWK